MPIDTDDLAVAAAAYKRSGFAIVRVFDDAQASVIERFARDWLNRLIGEGAGGREVRRPLKTYHTWWDSIPIDHDSLFRAPNRHASPAGEVRDALLNGRVWDMLSRIEPGRHEVWDEGLGWVAFRFIRPGMQDGYSPSRKEWGPAKRVVSFWIPVIGHTDNETLALVPGSHLREYKKYLPTDGKFCPNEYRLAAPLPETALLRPTLRPGEIIVYHPRLIHTEDVTSSSVTRLNLEIRFNPLDPD